MTITLDLLVDEVRKVTSFSGRYICKDEEGKSVDVYASATDATFESMPTQPYSRINELLPHNWKPASASIES